MTTAPSNPIIDVRNTGLFTFIVIRSMAPKNVTDPIGVGPQKVDVQIWSLIARPERLELPTV
jgi:hypothetical protein